MLPTVGPGGTVLTGLAGPARPVPFTRATIKGVEYAMFQAAPGTYTASYSAAAAATAAAPSVLRAQAAPTASGTGDGTVALRSAVPAAAEVRFGTAAAALAGRRTDPVAATAHTLRLGGLAPATTYYYRVTTTTPGGKRATWPDPARPPASFRTPSRDTSPPVPERARVAALPDGTAEVAWTTREPADAQVIFGGSPDALTAQRRDPAAGTAHSLVLSRLRPNATYWYRVVSRDAAGNTRTWPDPDVPPATFRTLPAGVADRDVAEARATFRSRVLDAGAMVTWDRAVWEPGTLRPRVSVRTGSTPRPDSSWSPWRPLAGPGARVVGESRYLQYRVEPYPAGPGGGPVLRAVGFTHNGRLPTAPGETGPPRP